MNKKIEKVVKILKANEEALSDGYGYYSEYPERVLTDIAQAILDELEAVEPESGTPWVSVADRTPEVKLFISDRVLVYDEAGDMFVEAYVKGLKMDKGFFYHNEDVSKITHWRPLPPPPGAKEDPPAADLRARAEKAEAEAERLRGLINQVEWVTGNDENTYCAWCWGEEPGPKPTPELYAEEWEYQSDLRRWRELGHKPDCQRQAALTAAEGEGAAT